MVRVIGRCFRGCWLLLVSSVVLLLDRSPASLSVVRIMVVSLLARVVGLGEEDDDDDERLLLLLEDVGLIACDGSTMVFACPSILSDALILIVIAEG